ncbi:uncharacterized protein LOC133531106 [Cydia pomonella]|uniref:uncharacterized protein LOC133531106 n=1 Tax=Cydia pomonella TaxID=82600 RepID=UPI002ADD5A2F|nr:uncharacterized protein LOC133531106 [Cydia pomonella]
MKMETVTLVLTTNLFDKPFSKTDSGNVYKMRITDGKLKEIDEYLKEFACGSKSEKSIPNHKNEFSEWTVKLIEKHQAICKKKGEKQEKTILILHFLMNWWISITSTFRNSYSKLVEETISPIPTPHYEEIPLQTPREPNPGRKIEEEKCHRPKPCIVNSCLSNFERKEEKSKKVQFTSSRQKQTKSNVKTFELLNYVQAKVKTSDTEERLPKCNTRQKSSKKTKDSKHKNPTRCNPAKKILYSSNRSCKIKVKHKLSSILARFKKKERYFKMGFFLRSLASWKSPAYTRLDDQRNAQQPRI